jgi:hypothetical protein
MISFHSSYGFIFLMIYFILRLNSAQVIAVAIATLSDSAVGALGG